LAGVASAGPQKSVRRPSALSNAGWSTILADLNRLVGKRSSRVAERVKLKIRATTTSAEGIRWGPAYPPSFRLAVDQLDQLPADEQRAAGRAGVTWATPRREGLQVLAWEGCAGALRFAFFSPRVLLSERSLCRSSREARRARDAPGGAARRRRRHEESRSAAAEHEEGISMLRSSWNRS
jgi:hypothetical protein